MKKVKGSLIRSRDKWIDEGEKPTSFFLNLENRNFIPKVQKENGDIISDQENVWQKLNYSMKTFTSIEKRITLI